MKKGVYSILKARFLVNEDATKECFSPQHGIPFSEDAVLALFL